jgi:hypothetical protein
VKREERRGENNQSIGMMGVTHIDGERKRGGRGDERRGEVRERREK